jgi:biopolymer transport protein ExbD
MQMASVASSSSRGRGTIVGINVTPMVDIVLVLLIIMMVSATYIVSQSIKVELPKTASSDDTVSKTHVVTITKDGQYLFNDKATSQRELPALLRGAKAENKDLNLVITADEQARHGNVVGVIDLAKVEGITKFAINVEAKQ